MSKEKDKKIIDNYMKKHPKASPKKIEEYAEKKGINVDVMLEKKRQEIINSVYKELGLDSDATKEQLDTALISLDVT